MLLTEDTQLFEKTTQLGQCHSAEQQHDTYVYLPRFSNALAQTLTKFTRFSVTFKTVFCISPVSLSQLLVIKNENADCLNDQIMTNFNNEKAVYSLMAI